ncbi:NADP-dependent oxidoreductase domain-containing protein [Biscogniauxia sp. FL1348]|nr:NADP-dependent oxidoreductase domain-containing protein [Biscogniauxia sp. FL1348]
MPLIASKLKDRIILGLMTFGPDAAAGARITDLDEFNKCLDHFQSRGYNEIDTARVYVAGKQEAFTKEARGKSADLPLPPRSKTSLKELGTDSVDICYIHAADRATPFAETLEALDKLHKAGKFVQLGLSNFTAAEVAEVVMTCKYNGWVRPTVYQGMYNIITRGIDAELIPACRRYGLDIVVYNPIAGGLFSGKVKSADMDPEDGRFSSKSTSGKAYRERYLKESTFKALQTIEKALEKHPGLTMIETALRWTVHHSQLRVKNGNDGILIGVSSRDQLENNLDNLEKGPLPEDVVQALDQAWLITKAEAPNYWHKDLVYKYDTREALFSAGANDDDRRRHSPLYGHGSPTLDGDSDDNMSGRHATTPSYLPAPDGRPVSPLLKKPPTHDRGRMRPGSPLPPTPSVTTPSGERPSFPRRRSMRSRSRSRSPADTADAKADARKRYTYAGIFLVVSLVSFCLQTELGRYVQHELGWDKAYCMLYLTHGSWALLWPAQLGILRLRARDVPWPVFWRRHVEMLRSTAVMVAEKNVEGGGVRAGSGSRGRSPVPYLLRTTAFVTSALTVAGLSWYVAVSMTSPSDLTAIYNCSAFFAYAFSVPLLREKLRLDKSIAVLVAIVGVLIVAYGDSKEETGGGDGAADEQTQEAGMRFLGNMIIGAGSVLYGLYEVLYKRLACPPEGTSPARGMIFANAFGSCVGVFTLTVLWIPLPVLHMLGWETFELPTGRAAFYLLVSVLMNATFAGSFLVLISLTSPVLSSVAALLTIFIVAVADWLITGEAMSRAAAVGGCLIVAAFLMLSWSTWREMTEEGQHGGGASGGMYERAEVADWSSEDEDGDVDGGEDEDEEAGKGGGRLR